MPIVDFFFDAGQNLIDIFRGAYVFLVNMKVPSLTSAILPDGMLAGIGKAFDFISQFMPDSLKGHFDSIAGSVPGIIDFFDGMSLLDLLLGPGLLMLIFVAVVKWFMDILPLN